MSCDIFSKDRAKELLRGKSLYFFGDSNVRCLYKDLIWLLEDGGLIQSAVLKNKNEESHANDVRLSNGKLHSGRNYIEVREYTKDLYIRFEFITRLYLPDFIDTIKSISYNSPPDIIIINSCIWDLSRWGPGGIYQYKKNVLDTLVFLKVYLTSTRIIWLTTLPPTFQCKGGFLTKEIKFLRSLLPWHIVHANKYTSELANFLEVDVIDLHYHFRFLMNHHAKDGIHWNAIAMRYTTNLLLTHIALIWNCTLPCRVKLDIECLKNSEGFFKNPDRKIHCKYAELKNETKKNHIKRLKKSTRKRSGKGHSQNVKQ